MIEASNGKELIGLLATHTPDVILMDIKMPEMDGMQTTAYMNQNFKTDQSAGAFHAQRG